MVLQLADALELPLRECNDLLPVLPLVLRIGDTRLSLFTTLTTFGTPLDVTTDELRVESFYPMDEETRAWFRGHRHEHHGISADTGTRRDGRHPSAAPPRPELVPAALIGGWISVTGFLGLADAGKAGRSC